MMIKRKKNKSRKERVLCKKSQVWTLEYIVSFILFIAIILLSVKMIFGIYANDALADLQKESESVSQYLLSEGYPDDWDNNTLIRVGLTTNNRLNESKLSNLFATDYSKTKDTLGIGSNFFIYFSNASGTISLFHIVDNNISESDGCGYGHYGVIKQYDVQCVFNLTSLKYDDMVKISRITNHDGSIIQLNVLIWR